MNEDDHDDNVEDEDDDDDEDDDVDDDVDDEDECVIVDDTLCRRRPAACKESGVVRLYEQA